MRRGRSVRPQDAGETGGRADERREQGATFVDVADGVRANATALHPLPPKHHADRNIPANSALGYVFVMRYLSVRSMKVDCCIAVAASSQRCLHCLA